MQVRDHKRTCLFYCEGKPCSDGGWFDSSKRMFLRWPRVRMDFEVSAEEVVDWIAEYIPGTKSARAPPGLRRIQL
jgi:hypothetical protein